MDIDLVNLDDVASITLSDGGGMVVKLGENDEQINVGLPPAIVHALLAQLLAVAKLNG